MKALFLSFVGAASLLAAVPASSHHSFAAEFDINRPVKLTGPVTKLEWTNPHAWVFVDAKDDKGNVQNWGVELVGINDLMRAVGARPREHGRRDLRRRIRLEERLEPRERGVGEAREHGRALVGERAARGPEGDGVEATPRWRTLRGLSV